MAQEYHDSAEFDDSILFMNPAKLDAKQRQIHEQALEKQKEKERLDLARETRIADAVQEGNDELVYEILNQGLLPNVLWITPDPELIQFIVDQTISNGCNLISSIGAGTGLLEWLIQKYCQRNSTHISVVAYEVEGSRTQTSKFVQLEFIDPSKTPVVPTNSALFICYGHRSTAFFSYLKKYSGRCVIIVGTDDDVGYSPRPSLDLDSPWTKSYSTFRHGVCVSVYTRLLH